MSLLEGADSIGICGATSTPRWLMADIAELIKNNLEKNPEHVRTDR